MVDEPRLLTRQALKAYLGNLPCKEIVERVQRGQIPSQLWRVGADDKLARWERKSVDQALDEARAIPNSIERDIGEMDRAIGLRR
jgi:hypothetical protein